MSSDVMIVCKEFNNWYDCMTKENNYRVDIPAVFIDEASMGQPWSEFGKWFVDKYYNGNGMAGVIMSITQHWTQDQIDANQSEIHDNPFKQFDYETIVKAMDTMQCDHNLDKEKVTQYLKKCVGNSISTENW